MLTDLTLIPFLQESKAWECFVVRCERTFLELSSNVVISKVAEDPLLRFLIKINTETLEPSLIEITTEDITAVKLTSTESVKQTILTETY